MYIIYSWMILIEIINLFAEFYIHVKLWIRSLQQENGAAYIMQEELKDWLLLIILIGSVIGLGKYYLKTNRMVPKIHSKHETHLIDGFFLRR